MMKPNQFIIRLVHFKILTQKMMKTRLRWQLVVENEWEMMIVRETSLEMALNSIGLGNVVE